MLSNFISMIMRDVINQSTHQHSTSNNFINIKSIQSLNSLLYSVQLTDFNDISINRINLATDYNLNSSSCLNSLSCFLKVQYNHVVMQLSSVVDSHLQNSQ